MVENLLSNKLLILNIQKFELRNSAVQGCLKIFSIPLEKISTSIGQLREAIKILLILKPGLMSKPLAQINTF